MEKLSGSYKLQEDLVVTAAKLNDEKEVCKINYNYEYLYQLMILTVYVLVCFYFRKSHTHSLEDK